MTGWIGRKSGQRWLALGVMALLVAGCSRGEPDMITFRAPQTGPDEFAILPTKPLEIPSELASLPAPAPGAPNRTDPTPEADAIAALGGNAATLGRPSGDGALVSYATRFGTIPGIRQVTAQEDLNFRASRNGRLLERWFNVTVYYRAYAPQSLNQHQELERFRRAGVRTPAAPPAPVE